MGFRGGQHFKDSCPYPFVVGTRQTQCVHFVFLEKLNLLNFSFIFFYISLPSQFSEVTAPEKPNCMIKSAMYYVAVLGLVFYFGTGFTHPKQDALLQHLYSAPRGILAELPSAQAQAYHDHQVPSTGKFFVGFKNALAQQESEGKYRKVNPWGFMGKYQFGTAALERVGITNTHRFLRSPELQEKALVALMSQHKKALLPYINYFEGRIIRGVPVTESGILAAAHLGGIHAVKRYLNSWGACRKRDKNGTSIHMYMHQFGGYDTRAIPANAHAMVE